MRPITFSLIALLVSACAAAPDSTPGDASSEARAQGQRGGSATGRSGSVQQASARRSSAPPADTYDEQQLRAAYGGARYLGTAPEGGVLVVDFFPDGRMNGVSPRDADTGRWWIDGDRLCRKWTRWDARQPEECFLVAASGDDVRWYRPDGTVYRDWER